MRKSLCFAVAILLMASCSEESYVGNKNLVNQETDKGAIAFGAGSSAITRGDLYGSAAAEKLGNKFVVYGTKHVSAEDKTASNDAVIFNNFQVEWTASTAGKTTSNSSDWGYVGLQAYDATPTSQGVKFWEVGETY